jgi:hypothetical protein
MRKSVGNKKRDVCERYKNSCEMSSIRLSKGSLRPVRRHQSESLRDIASTLQGVQQGFRKVHKFWIGALCKFSEAFEIIKSSV